MDARGRQTGVELFASGEHRGRPWKPAEIDAIVRNFRRFSAGPDPLHEARDGPGHEDGRTDLPSYGRYTKLYSEVQPCRLCKGRGLRGCKGCFGTGKRSVLKGDLDGITPEGMKKLAEGGFDQTSAEFYPHPGVAGLPGGPEDGPVFRRAAALAYEPPQVKGLAKRPPLEKYAEGVQTTLQVREVRLSKQGTWLCYSERVPVYAEAGNMKGSAAAMWAQTDDRGLHDKGRDGKSEYDSSEMEGGWHSKMGETMDRPAMLEKLKAAGVDVSAITDAVPDSLLAEMCRLADGPDADMDAADPAAMPPEQKAAFADRCKAGMGKYAERMKRFGESDVKPLTPADKKELDMKDMPADKFAEIVNAAVKAAVAKVEAGFGPLKERVESFEANTKKADIDKFCDAQLKAGRILPVDMDRGDGGKRPTLKDRLYRADAKAVVHKFSEGGKEIGLTELDLQMREIESRPTLPFGRQVRTGGADAHSEKAKVEAQASRPDFAHALKANGQTPQQYVQKFSEILEKDPTMTAARYGVPA